MNLKHKRYLEALFYVHGTDCKTRCNWWSVVSVSRPQLYIGSMVALNLFRNLCSFKWLKFNLRQFIRLILFVSWIIKIEISVGLMKLIIFSLNWTADSIFQSSSLTLFHSIYVQIPPKLHFLEILQQFSEAVTGGVPKKSCSKKFLWYSQENNREGVSFLITLQTFKSATLLKRDSKKCAFLLVLQNFEEQLQMAAFEFSKSVF